jgi:hypothetical protein
MHCAGSIGDTQQGFLKENIAGHAEVGIEELRCTGGAGETTTPYNDRWKWLLTAPRINSPDLPAPGRNAPRVLSRSRCGANLPEPTT